MDTPQVQTQRPGAEIERAMEAFSTISGDLVNGFQALAARAEHVEEELQRANLELERKVCELDAVRSHLEAILASLPTGVIVRDANGMITRTNEAARAILGATDQELIGTAGPASLANHPESCQAATFDTPDGERKTIASRTSSIHSTDAQARGFVEILDDQTELTQMQERLHQLDKMAALGTVAGGIAHEIRNPMNAIKGFANLLAKEVAAGSKHAHWAKLINDGVNEADTIIASVLSFSHPEQLHLETLTTSELVTDTLELVQRDLEQREHASLWTVSHAVEECSFTGDRIKLRQALRNVIANAIGAQPEGGQVHVEVTQDANNVTFRVSDAGEGFTTEALAHATELFFTTNASGTGLGLALVHTIVQLHAGHFEAEREASSLGGASVLFRIPKNIKS